MKARITVVETVVHQRPDEQPIGVDTRFSRALNTMEQVYVRQQPVDSGWRKLDTGWLTAAGMLVVVNPRPRYETIQTEEVQTTDNAKVIELGMWPTPDICTFARVHVGESARFQPVDLLAVRIRCVAGPSTVTLHVMPE